MRLNQAKEAPTLKPGGDAHEKVSPTPLVKPSPKKTEKSADTVIPRHHETTQATTTPRYRDTMIETIRQAVKGLGKEAATHRFTLEEKKAIADMLFTYRMSGVRTSENEIARIAINFVVSDYKENGENSVLNKVLKALNE